MATRYVATTGSDSTGTGTLANPWATLAKGLTTSAVGDTIQMRGGTYGTTYYKGRDTVIVENYPGENVVIQRTTSGTAVLLENCRNMTFRRHASGGSFTVRSTLLGDGQNSGIQSFITGGGSGGFVPTNLTFDGLIVNNIAGWGIQIKDTSNVNITNCDIYNNATGVRFQRVTGASFIQYSRIHHQDRMIRNTVDPTNDDNGGTAIGLDDGTNGAIVQWNLLYENHAPSEDYGIDGGCVEHFANSNCITQYNICYNNATFIETGTSNATTYPMLGNIVRRNLVYAKVNYSGGEPGIYHRAGDLRVENNTFDLDDGTGVIVLQGSGGSYAAPMHNTRIRNNILVSRNAGTPCLQISNVTGISGLVVDRNLLYNSTGSGAVVVTANNYGGNKTGTQLAAWQAASPFSDNDVWNADPAWVNRAIRDYNLLGTSPARDAGMVISGTTDGYLGSAPDMGRYEYAPTTSSVTAVGIRATGTGQAFNATIHTTTTPGPFVYVDAQTATGTGQAFNAGVDTTSTTTALGGVASGTGQAFNATAIKSSNDTAPGITATGSGVAFNATILSTSQTRAIAGVATGTGLAFNATPKASSRVTGQTASGTGFAFNASAGSTSTVYVPTTTATGTGTAYNATIRPSTRVAAGVASGIGQAFDATVNSSSQTVAVAIMASGTGVAYDAQVAPAPPIITTPAANGYDPDGVLIVSGTAEEGAVVELFDGVTSLGTRVAVGGTWEFNLTGIADGAHSYTATATDAQSNVSDPSDARVITVESTDPTMVSSSPSDTETGVALATDIVVTFSEPMNPLTIDSASFRVLAAGITPVAGTITMSAGDTVATFNPTSDLDPGTVYTVELSPTIQDVAGNPLP